VQNAQGIAPIYRRFGAMRLRLLRPTGAAVIPERAQRVSGTQGNEECAAFVALGFRLALRARPE